MMQMKRISSLTNTDFPSSTLLKLTLLVEVSPVFQQRGVVSPLSCGLVSFSPQSRSARSEAEESQKRSRVGRLAAGICAALCRHAGPTCYRKPPPWHEQVLTALQSSPAWQTALRVVRAEPFHIKQFLVSAEVWISDQIDLQRSGRWE